MNIYIVYFTLFALFFQAQIHAKWVDLEECLDEFIVETNQICLPEYPDAFNPSMIRLNDSILMIFRIRDPISKSTNEMGLVWLNENFERISKVYLLEVRNRTSYGRSFSQDPRLIKIANDFFIVYNDTLGSLYKDVRRMVVAKLQFDKDAFFIDNPRMLTLFDHEIWNRHEKNWVPFNYQDHLMLAYSIQPHSILKPIIHEERCESISSTICTPRWSYGELRGGTQGLIVGNEYLAFFHSSREMQTMQSSGKKITHYFMGAYTFESSPPFAITSMSDKPIIGKNFYNGKIHKTWKPLRVVFPGGYVFNDRYIWVAYGRQDHEIWIAKMDRDKLLKSLRKT